jgi:3,4-dihydroxy 2-butanone 4-phosphate synthase/GTP cyclohydrolase II
VAAVERISIAPLSTNEVYLRTKRDRMGHDLLLDPEDKGATA